MDVLTKSPEQVYNEQYFSSYGHLNEHYLGSMAVRLTLRGLSSFLVSSLNLRGKKHLDVGCALGFLVQYMREKGVVSYGFDVSEYAIKNAVPEARRFVWVQDITRVPIRQRYDLITCVEVIEHIPMEYVFDVLRMMVARSRWVYLSSEYNLDEPTHVSCAPLSFWIFSMWRLGYAPLASVYSGIPWGRIYYKSKSRKTLDDYLLFHTRDEIFRRDNGRCAMCGESASDIAFLTPREKFDDNNVWEAYAHWNRALLCRSCVDKLKHSVFVEALRYKIENKLNVW